jgi:hypothetical protein
MFQLQPRSQDLAIAIAGSVLTLRPVGSIDIVSDPAAAHRPPIYRVQSSLEHRRVPKDAYSKQIYRGIRNITCRHAATVGADEHAHESLHGAWIP